LDRLQLIIEEVEEYISDRQVRPKPDKISLVATALYKTEINLIVDRADAQFDTTRQLWLIEVIFKWMNKFDDGSSDCCRIR